MTEDKKLEKYGPVVGTFRSKSNPDEVYEVRQKDNQEPTCNCPGWARSGRRECRHTKALKGDI